MADPTEIYILNPSIPVGFSGKNRSEKDVQLLTEDDRTLRVHGLNVIRRGSGGNAEIVALGENNGRPTVVGYGKDSSGNQDAVRTDPNRILWTRPFENWLNIDPVLVPSTEGILFNPGTTAAEIYWVQYKIVNVDAGGAAVTVSVGADIAAGGGLATLEYDMFNEVIPYPGSSGWRDLGMIGGDDDVRGIASAADDAIIRFKIRRVDTGA